jgi:hypothetical protein
VLVISVRRAVTCRGRVPGGSGTRAGAEVGAAAMRGAIGVFSLLVS